MNEEKTILYLIHIRWKDPSVPAQQEILARCDILTTYSHQSFSLIHNRLFFGSMIK